MSPRNNGSPQIAGGPRKLSVVGLMKDLAYMYKIISTQLARRSSGTSVCTVTNILKGITIM